MNNCLQYSITHWKLLLYFQISSHSSSVTFKFKMTVIFKLLKKHPKNLPAELFKCCTSISHTN